MAHAQDQALREVNEYLRVVVVRTINAWLNPSKKLIHKCPITLKRLSNVVLYVFIGHIAI